MKATLSSALQSLMILESISFPVVAANWHQSRRTRIEKEKVNFLFQTKRTKKICEKVEIKENFGKTYHIDFKSLKKKYQKDKTFALTEKKYFSILKQPKYHSSFFSPNSYLYLSL